MLDHINENKRTTDVNNDKCCETLSRKIKQNKRHFCSYNGNEKDKGILLTSFRITDPLTFVLHDMFSDGTMNCDFHLIHFVKELSKPLCFYGLPFVFKI